jgi:hypothetical protein
LFPLREQDSSSCKIRGAASRDSAGVFPRIATTLDDVLQTQGLSSWLQFGLFTDDQQRLLGLLFGQPDREFHINELVDSSGCGCGFTHRRLGLLERDRLVRTRRERGRKYFQANPDCDVYADVVGLVRKTFGLAQPLRAAFQLLERRVDAVFVFEGLELEASRRPPLEMLVVSRELRVESEAIDFAIDVAVQVLHRDVRVLVVKPEELNEPRWFLAKVLGQPRIWVFGDERKLAGMTSGP